MEIPKFWRRKLPESEKLNKMMTLGSNSLAPIQSELAQRAVYIDHRRRMWEEKVANLPPELQELIYEELKLIKEGEQLVHDSAWTHILRGHFKDSFIIKLLNEKNELIETFISRRQDNHKQA